MQGRLLLLPRKELAISTWQDDHKQPEVAAIQIDLYIVHLIEKDHLGDRSPEKDCC